MLDGMTRSYIERQDMLRGAQVPRKGRVETEMYERGHFSMSKEGQASQHLLLHH